MLARALFYIEAMIVPSSPEYRPTRAFGIGTRPNTDALVPGIRERHVTKCV